MGSPASQLHGVEPATGGEPRHGSSDRWSKRCLFERLAGNGEAREGVGRAPAPNTLAVEGTWPSVALYLRGNLCGDRHEASTDPNDVCGGPIRR